MQIIEYNKKYEKDVKDLLEELQDYLVSLDKEGYNQKTEDYRDSYYNKTMEEVRMYQGKIFIAIQDNHAIGLIVGIINNEEIDSYDFKVPKRGRVTELIVSKRNRSLNIGTSLLEKMEEYFKNIGCKGVMLGVFSYNQKALSFYQHHGYFERTRDLMKLI